jgi:hypothetical protein
MSGHTLALVLAIVCLLLATKPPSWAPLQWQWLAGIFLILALLI